MNFIQTIFFKITEAVATFFIAVGIVSSPVVIPIEPTPTVVVNQQEKVSEIQTNKGQNKKKEVLVGSNTQEPAVEKPADLQDNKAQTEFITPHIPHQSFFFIVEREVTPSQEVPTQEMAKSAKTYTVKKEGETIKSGLLIGDLQKFVASLNTYLTWKKKANSASVEELTEMLSSNGYELIES